MGEVFVFILGEILGDSSFFLARYSEENEVSTRERERRNYLFMPILSVLLSVTSIGTCVALQMLLRAICHLAMNIRPQWNWSQFNEIFGAVLEFFPSLSGMWLYMFLYRFARNKTEKFCVGAGRNFYKRHENFLHIYERNNFSGRYFLSDKWQNVLECMKWIIFADMLLLAVLHTEYVGMPVHDIRYLKAYELIPVSVITILFEIYYFLGGNELLGEWTWYLKRKKKGEPEMDLDLPYLKICFNNTAQQDGVRFTMETRQHDIQMDEEVSRYLERYEGTENPGLRYLFTYLQSRDAEYSCQIPCVETVVKLLEGKNIFFATPFYYDLDICIFFPAYMSLIRNEKVLILMEDTGNLLEVAQWVKAGVEGVQDLTDLWKVDVITNTTDDADVGIMAFQDLYKNHLEWQNPFFHKVSFVVILEASGILTGGQEAVASLAGRIGRGVPKCRWLLCSRNAESMIDLFSHLLNQEFTYVSATPLYAGESVTAYWNAESEPQKPWEPVERYLGTESRIIEVAAREKIPQISWYGEDWIPIYDMRWVMGQYYEQYGERTGEKPFQNKVDDHILIGISGNANRRRKNQFLIVEDDCFNLYEAARQYATRAEDKIFVNIISPRYMMRDFMKENPDTMRADAKWITQFVPEHVDSKRNIILRLTRKLLERPVSGREIRYMFAGDEDIWDETFGITDQSIHSLVNTVMETRNYNIVISCRYEFVENNDRTEPELYYQLAGEELQKELDGYFCQASYIDETGNKKHISRMMLAGHLDQKYQTGQFAVFDGKYYEIIGKTVSGYEQSLLVKRASEQITGRRYYRQNRGYVIESKAVRSHLMGDIMARDIFLENNIEVKRYCADIKAYTYGYVEMDSWNDICGGRKVFWKEDEKERSRDREYKCKQVLEVKVHINGPSDKFLVVRMAALFAELFCTLYPQYYHLLSVAVSRAKYQDILAEAGMEADEEESLGAILYYVLANMKEIPIDCFYILEDSREDMGLLRSVERNFGRILRILESYISWSSQSGDDYFKFRR